MGMSCFGGLSIMTRSVLFRFLHSRHLHVPRSHQSVSSGTARPCGYAVIVRRQSPTGRVRDGDLASLACRACLWQPLSGHIDLTLLKASRTTVVALDSAALHCPFVLRHCTFPLFARPSGTPVPLMLSDPVVQHCQLCAPIKRTVLSA